MTDEQITILFAHLNGIANACDIILKSIAGEPRISPERMWEVQQMLIAATDDLVDYANRNPHIHANKVVKDHSKSDRDS